MATRKEAEMRINAEYGGQQMSGISFLTQSEASEFASSGRIPINFQINEDGDSIPQFQYQTAKGKQKGIHSVIKDENLWYLYLRQDICNRGVNRKADDAFRKPFTVRVINDAGEEQEDHSAAAAIRELNEKVKVRERFREGFKSKRLFGLGLVAFGLNDGGDNLSTAVGAAQDIEFLRVFWRIDLKEIKLPLYIFRLYKPDAQGDVKEEELKIHESRLQRVCNDTTLYGIGETTPLFNILEGLMNVDWAAFETYFQMASPILTLVWQGEIETAKEKDLDYLEEQMQKVTVTKRFIIPSKYEFKWVGPETDIPDPGKWWEWLIKRASSGYGVPQHILLGVEAGQKLGVENTLQQYYADVANEQSPFLENVLIEFYERMRDIGVIPGWEGLKLDIVWAPLWEESDKERWETNKMMTEAVGKAVLDKVITKVEGYVWMRDGELPERKDPETPDLGEFEEEPEPFVEGPQGPFAFQENAYMVNERGQRVPIPYQQMNVRAVGLDEEMRPILAEVHAGTMEAEQAKRIIGGMIVKASDSMRKVAFTRLEQMTGLEIKALPPEAQASIDGEIAKLTSLADRLVEDAAEGYESPTPQAE